MPPHPSLPPKHQNNHYDTFIISCWLTTHVGLICPILAVNFTITEEVRGQTLAILALFHVWSTFWNRRTVILLKLCYCIVVLRCTMWLKSIQGTVHNNVIINHDKTLSVWLTTTGGNHTLLPWVVPNWKSLHNLYHSPLNNFKCDFQLTRMA